MRKNNSIANSSFSFKLTNAFSNCKLVLLTTFCLMAVLLFTNSSQASPAAVAEARLQAICGLSIDAYFADVPTVDSPVTVHTTKIVNAASGFFVIPKGESAYFWSTQFSVATAIPEGKLILNLWAQTILPGSDAVLSVSAYTTDSEGAVCSMLFVGQAMDAVPQESGQVSTVFSVAAGEVPAAGYVKVVLMAPEESAVKVYWGSGQPSNFQIYFTYSRGVMVC
jgi:hypothetical protein